MDLACALFASLLGERAERWEHIEINCDTMQTTKLCMMCTILCIYDKRQRLRRRPRRHRDTSSRGASWNGYLIHSVQLNVDFHDDFFCSFLHHRLHLRWRFFFIFYINSFIISNGRMDKAKRSFNWIHSNLWVLRSSGVSAAFARH